MTASAAASARSRRAMSFTEFVSLIAALMAVNALAIDSMLPALPAIARSLGIASGNEQQWIITAYLLGFGVSPDRLRDRLPIGSDASPSC